MGKKKNLLIFAILYVVSFVVIFSIKNYNKNAEIKKEEDIQKELEDNNAAYEKMYENGVYMYNKGAYQSAKNEVGNISNLWDEYAKVEKLISDCDKKLIEELLLKVQKYVDANEYEEALELINSSEYRENIEVRTVFAECETVYVEQVLTQVRDMVENDDSSVKEGMNIIDNALNVVDNKDLRETKNYYMNLLPVSLFDQNVFFGDLSVWAPVCNDVEDIEGHKYSTVRKIAHSDNYTFSDHYKIVFSLEGQYSKVTGSFVLPKGELDKNYEASNWIVFYGDDGEQLGVSSSCNKNNSSASFSIDVTGVKHLTLICTRDTFLGAGYSYIVDDFELYK